MTRAPSGVRIALGLLLLGPAAVAQETNPALTPRARFMSGKLYMEQKLFDKAEEQLGLAVEGDPENGEYRAFRARVMCELAREKLNATSRIRDIPARLEAIRAVAPIYENARREFLKAIELNPKEMGDFCRDNLIHYWVDVFKQGEGQFRIRNYEESHRIFLLAVALDPEEPQGHLYTAYSLDRLGRLPEAMETAQRAAELALKVAAGTDCAGFRTPKAQRECEKRLEGYRQVVANVDDFMRSRNIEAADRAFDASMTAETPERRRELLSEALVLFEKALALDPDLRGVRFKLGNVYFSLAQTYEEESDSTKANPWFRKAAGVFLAVGAADSVSETMKADALFNATNALYAAAEWEALVPLYQGQVDSNPRDPMAYRRVAECLAELRRSAEAVSYLMAANALSENSALVIAADVTRVFEVSAGDDASRSVADLGEPGEVRSYREMDSGRVIHTWFWWKKGEMRHFVNGREVGRVRFRAVN